MNTKLDDLSVFSSYGQDNIIDAFGEEALLCLLEQHTTIKPVEISNLATILDDFDQIYTKRYQTACVVPESNEQEMRNCPSSTVEEDHLFEQSAERLFSKGIDLAESVDTIEHIEMEGDIDMAEHADMAGDVGSRFYAGRMNHGLSNATNSQEFPPGEDSTSQQLLSHEEVAQLQDSDTDDSDSESDKLTSGDVEDEQGQNDSIKARKVSYIAKYISSTLSTEKVLCYPFCFISTKCRLRIPQQSRHSRIVLDTPLSLNGEDEGLTGVTAAEKLSSDDLAPNVSSGKPYGGVVERSVAYVKMVRWTMSP